MAIKVNYVTGSPIPERSGYGKYSKSVLSELRHLPGLSVREITVDFPLHFPYKNLLLNFSATPFKAMRERSGAITHATSQGLAFLGTLHFKPFVVTAYDAIAFALPEERQSIAKRLLLSLMRRGLRRANAIITISEFSRRELSKYAGLSKARIHVAYPAVDTRIFKPLKSAKPDLNTVLYVGSEQPRKNTGVLLEAFALAKKRIPRLNLLKVGAPQWREGRKSFMAKARQLGVERDISFIESVSEHELAAVYNRAGVLVFPSTYEGFGLPPLEAMACGLPVISSNAASLPEVTGKAAISLDPRNVSGFASAIVHVLKDGKLRKRLRIAGLRQSKKFTWRKAALATKRVYDRL